MREDIYDSSERAKIVAKDIRAASDLVNHPNFRYIPSKQLYTLMSAEEIATTIMHLNRIGVLSIDARHMYAGGYIRVFPAYDIQTDKSALKELIDPSIISVGPAYYVPIKKINYSPSDRLLAIGEQSMRIKGDMMSNLCDTILTCPDRSKVWSNDEVFESWGWPEHKIFDENFAIKQENRLKIYQKAKLLNERIALLTKGDIDDLFDFTTKSICINSKYRKRVS